ncbi:GyrI-like domain-containing protein [Nocardioides sambongensis]|uniref:GyrI-like domain-containing protein n=1 Tax=Nocardioides sambongensis TaxID=2589074 RepID=UPI0015E84D22|nr:GyrI-like domain-containing protein [Nocardioides sambongensis]
MTPLVLTPDPVTGVETVEVPPGITTVELRHGGVTIDRLPALFDAGYAVLAGLGPIGPGYAVYDGDPSVTFDLTIGFPVAQVPGELPDRVVVTEFPPGRALMHSHVGGFDGLVRAWSELSAHPDAQGRARSIEIYVNDPSVTPAEQLRTDLLVPLG